MASDLDNDQPKTNQSERTFLGSDPIPPIDGTVVAFIGRAQRGPVNQALTIQSYEEFRKIFGGPVAFSFLSHAVLHFFQNGGQQAVIVRLINRGRRARLNLPAGAEFLNLVARYPGSHELIRVSVDHDGWDLHPTRFNLTVQRVARQGSQLVEDQEIFRGLSIDQNHDRHFVDVLANSQLVAVAGPLPSTRPARTVSSFPGEPVAYLAMDSEGSDGDELTDYDIVGSREEGTGLFALNAVERIDILCVPAPPGKDLGITSLVAAERYCRERYAMLIVDPAWQWKSPEAALLGLRRFGFRSEYALSYFPRLRPREGAHRFIDGIPACGAVAGLLARKDERDGLWCPVNGDNAVLRGGLVPTAELDDHSGALLGRYGINVFSRAGSGGISLSGDVSFAGPGAIRGSDQRLCRRRLLLRIIDSIQRGTAFAQDLEPSPEVHQRMVRVVQYFLLTLFEAGALRGQSPEQAFFVHSGSSDGNGIVVGVALDSPRRFAVVEISQSPTGGHSQMLSTESVVGVAV